VFGPERAEHVVDERRLAVGTATRVLVGAAGVFWWRQRVSTCCGVRSLAFRARSSSGSKLVVTYTEAPSSARMRCGSVGLSRRWSPTSASSLPSRGFLGRGRELLGRQPAAVLLDQVVEQLILVRLDHVVTRLLDAHVLGHARQVVPLVRSEGVVMGARQPRRGLVRGPAGGLEQARADDRHDLAVGDRFN
jgi:hypothetical protein